MFLLAADPNPLAILAPILFFGIIALLVIGVLRWQHVSRIAALRAVSSLWNGRVFDAGMFGESHAELQIANTVARVQFTNVNKQVFTEFTIHFPDPALRLELYPQTIFHQMRKFLGMQDIEVGVRRFDDAFIIQGNNPELIREYLTLPVQGVLQNLAKFSFYENLHLLIGGRSLRLTKSQHLKSEREMVQFVTLCESLFNALLEARTVGIEYLPAEPPSLRPSSHCQVCGEGLAGKIVYCSACQTPHHLDCWQYIGHCSVYACGQKRYRAAR